MKCATGTSVPAYRLSVVRTRAYRAIAGAWRGPALLACSGGTDSMAMVVLAREAHRSGNVGPFLVCHVDHRSRPESAIEADVVRQLCAELGVPFVATRVSVDGLPQSTSTEAAWRERRYAALFGVCSSLGVRTLVTAHTRDDQVENVLMRMFSGASQWRIPAEAIWNAYGVRIQLQRPLIGTTRAELEYVLSAAEIRPVEDPSNLDLAYRRNAVRHSLMPVISDIFSGFEPALLRSAETREDDARYCNEVASAAFEANAQLADHSVTLPRSVLHDNDRAIASRLVLLAARQVIADTDTRELSHERVHAALEAAAGRSGAVIELPYGILMRVERKNVIFTSRVGRNRG